MFAHEECHPLSGQDMQKKKRDAMGGKARKLFVNSF